MADVSTTDDLKGGRVKNRRRVLDLLRQNGGLSQADLSDRTGLSRATVSSLVSELRQHQLLTDEEPRPEQARIGRPPAMVTLSGSVGAAVGVNITGESIQVAIGNVALDVLAEREVRPDQFAIGSEPDMTLRLIAAIVQELLATARLDRARVIGGAIGVPAPIDRRNGTVGPTTFLSNWQRSRPAEILESLVGFPVLIENDANLAAYAEAVSGAVEGAAHVVFVGSGDSVAIGTGLIIQGRVYSGAFGGAGEIAHMVVEPGGELCFCGRHGCLAQVVHGGTIVAEVQGGHRRGFATSEFDPDALDAPGLGIDRQLNLVVRWAREGDPISSRVLEDAGRTLGRAVANVCQILNPERVVVGGSLTEAGGIFMDPFIRAVHDHTRMLPGPPVPIVPSHWQERAELVGAVALGVRADNDVFAERLWRLIEAVLRDEPPPRLAS